MIIVNKKVAQVKSDEPGSVQAYQIREKINLYDKHPTDVISLHEFHSVALNRLQVLRKIEFM
jgi:hypothetical protein